jgi:hypothetical protein
MKPEGSLPHSQQPATCPYPEPYQKVLHIWDKNVNHLEANHP